MRAKKVKILIQYILLVPALLFLTVAGPIVLFGIGTEADFVQFYAAGQILRSPQRANLYSYETERVAQRNFTNHSDPLVYNHPPFEALLFIPLTFFSFRVAFLIWTYFSLSVLGVAVYALRDYLPHLGLAERLLLLMFFFYPCFTSLLQGQDSMLILLAYALALAALKKTGGSSRRGWLFPSL